MHLPPWSKGAPPPLLGGGYFQARGDGRMHTQDAGDVVHNDIKHLRHQSQALVSPNDHNS
ncbi:hypothetical protein GCM10018987_65240 [Streptomyces cremeus]